MCERALRVACQVYQPCALQAVGAALVGSLQFNHPSRIKTVFSRPFSKHPQAADAGEPPSVHKSRRTECISSELGSKALTTVLTRTADASSEESQDHAGSCRFFTLKQDVTVQPSNKKPAAQLGL